jgi:hypothetical protein
LLLTILLSIAVPVQAELYKWVDADGKVHYSDRPPPPSARKSERKQLSSKPGDVAVPYVLQQAMKNFPVTLYAFDCGEGCTQARALLAKRGVPHTAKDPQTPAIREELKKLLGGDPVVPVLQVGRSKLLRGFQEGPWNAALDAAGYPATPLLPASALKKTKPAEAAQPPAKAAAESPEESAAETADDTPAEPAVPESEPAAPAEN